MRDTAPMRLLLTNVLGIDKIHVGREKTRHHAKMLFWHWFTRLKVPQQPFADLALRCILLHGLAYTLLEVKHELRSPLCECTSLEQTYRRTSGSTCFRTAFVICIAHNNQRDFRCLQHRNNRSFQTINNGIYEKIVNLYSPLASWLH